MKAICFCCKREGGKVKPLIRRDNLRGQGVPLCQACRDDPSLAFSNCMHGTPALSDLLKF